MEERGRVGFVPEVFLQDLLAQDDDLVQDLATLLARPPSDLDLPEEGRPHGEILERIRAIDLLEDLADSKVTSSSELDALAALEDVVAMPVPQNSSAKQRRVLVAEKYDALAALARLDPQRAVHLYRELGSPQRQKTLRAALFTGFVDQGIAREDAEEYLAYLVSR